MKKIRDHFRYQGQHGHKDLVFQLHQLIHFIACVEAWNVSVMFSQRLAPSPFCNSSVLKITSKKTCPHIVAPKHVPSCVPDSNMSPLVCLIQTCPYNVPTKHAPSCVPDTNMFIQCTHKTCPFLCAWYKHFHTMCPQSMPLLVCLIQTCSYNVPPIHVSFSSTWWKLFLGSYVSQKHVHRMCHSLPLKHTPLCCLMQACLHNMPLNQFPHLAWMQTCHFASYPALKICPWNRSWLLARVIRSKEHRGTIETNWLMF